MNYGYDIVLNYTPFSSFIEFYEWKKEDTFTYVQKIPIFRISDMQMEEVMRYSFCMENYFLEKIHNQTITDKGVIPYSFLVTDEERVIAFLLDEEGKVIQKSSLLLDEEEALIEEVTLLECETLSYLKLEKLTSSSFLTREERDIQKQLLEKLNMIWEEKKYDEIHYLYQEFFHEPLTIKETYEYLQTQIRDYYQSKYRRLYDIMVLAESSFL